MQSKRMKTFAEATGASLIIARHNAQKLAATTAAKFGPGKITLAQAVGLSLSNDALFLAGQPNQAGGAEPGRLE